MRCTVSPNEGSVLDACHDLCLGDDVAVQRVHDNSRARDVDDFSGGSSIALGVLVEVGMLVRVSRGDASGGQSNVLELHVVGCEWMILGLDIKQ